MMSHKGYKDKVMSMCGLVALIKQKPITIEDLAFSYDSLQKMKHRGPDNQDLYYQEHIILGANQLNIQDHKESQPFHSDDFMLHLIFNGEIYNYPELRGQLEKLGFSFETTGESEVIFNLYRLLGIDFITQIRGMFSLILYNAKTKELIAVRDRFGIKPLYYYEEEGVLFLSSELKSFKQATVEEASIDFMALQHYFTFQYIPEPFTCLKDVRMLEPGTYLTYQLNRGIEIKTYHVIQLIPHHQISSIKKEQLETVIKESVRSQIQNEIEVGCFLSEELDSAIITACAIQFHPHIKAFTIAYQEAGDRKVKLAEQTADFFNIPLYTHTITATEFIKATESAIEYLDSPIADPSVITLYLAAKEARKQVKVILSGDGADELFGGYRYYGDQNFNKILSKLIPSHPKKQRIKRQYARQRMNFNEKEKEKFLNFYNSQFKSYDLLYPILSQNQHLDSVSQLQMLDLKTALIGNILTKSDRLSMAHALEIRLPFLDEKVFQIAKQLTTLEKIEKTQTKILLREAFKDIIPPHVYATKQKSDSVPLKKWLKDELYDDAKSLILSPCCEHLINQKLALHYLNQHALGRWNYSRKIWTIMTFVMWYQSWKIE